MLRPVKTCLISRWEECQKITILPELVSGRECGKTSQVMCITANSSVKYQSKTVLESNLYFLNRVTYVLMCFALLDESSGTVRLTHVATVWTRHFTVSGWSRVAWVIRFVQPDWFLRGSFLQCCRSRQMSQILTLGTSTGIYPCCWKTAWELGVWGTIWVSDKDLCAMSILIAGDYVGCNSSWIYLELKLKNIFAVFFLEK